MPGWHEATVKLVKDGRLIVLGVAQEQHGERCRLFAQWKGLDFPILHDPINLMGCKGVPIVVAIDEYGIVRSTDLKPETLESEFVNKTFEPSAEKAAKSGPASVHNPDELQRRAEQSNTADAWRALGDALALWHPTDRIDDAISAYSHALQIDPKDGASLFRLGVCCRMRYESPSRKPGDFQNAVDFWGRALETDPNRYIWRRRIQQYGPRLDKPYPFYDWVDRAAAEIRERGETPVELRTAPTGSEIAQPVKEFATAGAEAESPDPEGRVIRDKKGFAKTEVTVVPSSVGPGESAHVQVAFECSSRLKAHWNNDAEPLRFWIDPTEGWITSGRLFTTPQPKTSESDEVRRIEFDIQAPADASPGPVQIPAYALYYVCEDVKGSCWMLRQDVKIPLEVERK